MSQMVLSPAQLKRLGSGDLAGVVEEMTTPALSPNHKMPPMMPCTSGQTATAMLAVSLGQRGYWLIPVDPDTKIPKFKGWAEKDCQANGFPLVGWRDEKTLLEVFGGPTPPAIGILTWLFGQDGTDSLIGIDIDGAEGEATWQALLVEHKATETPTTGQETRRGRHLMYVLRNRRGVQTQAGDLGQGLDVRSANNGYLKVYGAGPDDVPLADADEWLIEECGTAKEKTPSKSTVPAIDLTDPVIHARVQRRVRDYLAEMAPLAEQGSGSETVVKRVTPHCWELGATQEEIVELMYERRSEVNGGQSWSDRCLPPWDDADELTRYVTNGIRYCTSNPQGCLDPSADFSAVSIEGPIAEADAPTQSRLYYELLDDIVPTLDRPALVKDLLDHGAMSVLYGESNSGKTFVALDLGFHLAANLSWMGRSVQPGLVVYIAAEGGGGIRNRCMALRLHYAVDALMVPFALIPCPVNLSGPGEDVQPLRDEIAKVHEVTGCAPVLIVIDTLSRALGGANENAPDDMTAFIRNVDRLRHATKAHLMIVHHTGKDRAKGARGHSSLRAATDTELEIADWYIVPTKQRDRDIGQPIGFRLDSVEIGRDASGQAVTSCVVLPHDGGVEREFLVKPPKPSSMTGRAWAVLETITGGLRSVSAEAWQEEFCRQQYPGKRKLGWQSFQRAKRILVAEGHIVEDHRGVRCAR